MAKKSADAQSEKKKRQKEKAKEQKKQKKLAKKTKKQEAKLQKKKDKLQKKIQRRDPAWKVQQMELKMQKQKDALQKKQKDAAQKAKAKEVKKAKKQQMKAKKQQSKLQKKQQKAELKLLHQDPEWKRKQAEEKAKAKLSAKQKKDAQKQKNLLKKQKDKEKKQQARAKKKEAAAKAKEQKKDPVWREQEKVRKAEAKIHAKEQKKLQKERNAAKKAKAKEAKLQKKLENQKPPLNPKLKVLFILIGLLVVGIIAGGATFILLHPSPTTTVERYLQAFKEQDVKAMSRYEEEGFNFIADKISDTEQYQAVNEIMLAKTFDIDFVVGEAEVDGQKAAVTVDFTVYDLSSRMKEAIAMYRKQDVVKLVSGKYDEIELEQDLVNLLVEHLSAAEKDHQETITVYLTKNDGRWRLDRLPNGNQELYRMLTGLVYRYVEE